MCILRHSIGEDLRILENSQDSREFSEFSRILRISKLKNEGAGDIWLETGDFPLPDERPAHFSRFFLTLWAAGGPGGSRRGQVEMEIQNCQKHTETYPFLLPEVLFGCWFQSGWLSHNLELSIAHPGDTIPRRIETPRSQGHFNRGPGSLCREALSRGRRWAPWRTVDPLVITAALVPRTGYYDK